jgi:hypothetical protein
MSGTGEGGQGKPPGAEQHWPPELFVLDPRGEATRARPAVLDITGPPRALVFGPYIALPPGTWRASVLFAVDEAACRRRFRVEWGGLSDFTSHAFTPGRPGLFRAELQHSWTGETVVEVRIILTESALDGALEPMGVTVSDVR